ncbi:DUF3263 domain-containing protein [Janibacter indicus]|uniref:DUF3263 domain-containing protein n=1 Tax=Janibacter indicus TaxID=857417 RepID=A0A1L3MHC2_9MICO|nr:DUF3263 domain-containing protein [Janibacter indicus]APH01672.1 hypothetical protein ASJ30_09140 [Janibacter indicus]QOK21593.1 DUF3263 domain-containing protein [Janibacter indicus]
MTRELTGTEVKLLQVWRRWPLDSQRDRRLNAYARLGLTEVRALQAVNGLLTDPAAWEHDPVTVARVRRLRDLRVR